MNSQFANITPGKENRINNITVSGKGQPGWTSLENCAVLKLGEDRVVQPGQEYLFNKVAAGNTAAAEDRKA